MELDSPEPEPLRRRLPHYLVLFGVGLAVAGLIGLVIWGATALALTGAVGYSFMGLGTVLLLVGGARGGGYSNLSLGAVEVLVGGRNRSDDDYEKDEELRRGRVMKRRDPMERLRRGLRPEANPTAFWQTVAGFLYLAMGAGISLI